MPVVFVREPLGCIIFAGAPGDDGIKIAVMAAPCDLRPPRLKLGRTTARTLEQLLDGPRRVSELSGTGHGGAQYVAAKQRCEALRRHGLADLHGRHWRITDAGRAWLATSAA